MSHAANVSAAISFVRFLSVTSTIPSIQDACSIFGQSDFELFMYARLLKSEIPDEIFPDMVRF